MSALVIDPAAPVVSLLDRFGPGGQSSTVTSDQALAYVKGLASSHYENFSVLSSLVPLDLRDDFAAVYAFCRWSDDLGDETGRDQAARDRSLELLAWWRTELDRCYAGSPSHPVYIALAKTIERRRLPRKPFDDLISAFEQDQRLREYSTWDQLVDYCTRSANPVGRLVLMLAGYFPEHQKPTDPDRFAMSDAICTALQLTNFWQDVRRDLIERDRIYLPETETGVSPAMLRDWLNRGDEPAVRIAYIRALRPLVDRTEELFIQGEALPSTLNPAIRPVVGLFSAGGQSVLNSVRRTGCTTLWQRPKLSKLTKLSLVARAFIAAKLSGTSSTRTTTEAAA